ncbi:hypothetical protein H4N58_16715 [Mumia sp. ZJ1417]|nr:MULTISPECIES: DUF6801 domain-containing protein [unclassified Mumia]QMW65794.1 hypothetical protein H4N58_16715 [Mumia sp. ZJ1417]
MAAAGLVVGGMQVGLAPVAGAAQSVSLNQVGYTCESDNEIINTSLGGPQQFLVNARTSLPDTVVAGDAIAETPAELDLILPAKLVTRIRDIMLVTKVGGGATSTVLLQGVVPGGDVAATLEPQVRGLSSPMVPVPASGSLLIPAKGTVDAVTVPELPDGVTGGLIYVQMPKTFKIQAKLDPPVLGAIAETELNCVRNLDTRAARVIGTIPVGDGCEESECPLPTVGGSPGGGDGDGNGGGGGGGEDPPVIDPPKNTDSTSPGGNGGSDDDDDDDDDGGVAPYTTTSLPATGSPVGVGLVGLLGLVAAARIALAVRTRRRAKTA